MLVVTPTADALPFARADQHPGLAARGPDLLRRTWALIDTSKVNADLFILRVASLVAQRHGADVLVVRKPAPGVGITAEQEDRIATSCGVAVICFGD